MKINHILFISFMIFLISCSSMSPDISGTGHEGEARVIGIAVTSAGTPLKNSELFVATPDFTPKNSRSSEPFGAVVSTDSTGKFELTLTVGCDYILSSNNHSEFLYRPFSVDELGIDFGTLYHEKGKTVTFHPSDNSDMQYTDIAVQGTNWQFKLEVDNSTVIALPHRDLSVVRKSVVTSTNSVTLDTILTEVTDTGAVIGTPATPKLTPMEYHLDDTAFYGVPTTFEMLYSPDWDSVQVFWGEPKYEDSAKSVIYCSDSLLGDSSAQAMWKYEYLGDSSIVYEITIHQFYRNDSLTRFDTITVLYDLM